MCLLLVRPAAAIGAHTPAGTVWDHGSGGSRYVALGDSAASGPLIENQRNDPRGCDRSDHNFPTIAAKLLSVHAFRDVTCGGASLDDLYLSQMAGQPPQLDALDGRTTDVTFGPFGANDVGLTNAVVSCLLTIADPTCTAAYSTRGPVSITAEIRALLAKEVTALRRVHVRAPHARVFVVGYGRYLPRGGCFPVEPYLPAAANQVQGYFNELDEMLAKAASETGATYVSLQGGAAARHTACAPFGRRWLEGWVPDSSAEPFHPSARGMAAFGRVVADHLRAASMAGR